MVEEQELYQEYMDIQRNLQRAEIVLQSYKNRIIRTEDQIHKMRKRLAEIEKINEEELERLDKRV